MPNHDLAVIDTNGVEFFKVFTNPLKIASIKQHQMNPGHYWYSSKDRVLLVALSPPKLGQFLTFFFNVNDNSKAQNGVKFNLDLTPSVTDKWTISPKNISSLTWQEENQAENSPHEISVINLYSQTYLLHVQCLSGNITLYKLSPDNLVVFKEYQLKSGQFGIRALDNLILMQNYTLQETYVIDIKEQGGELKPYCVFWNGMKNVLPNLSVKLRVFIEKPKVVVSSALLYDGKQINDLNSFLSSKSLGGDVLECKMALIPDLLYVDHDICVDVKAGRCYKLKFSPLISSETHPDRSGSLLFLFRRAGLKMQACEYLKRSIETRGKLSEFQSFFNMINENYKNSIIDKKPQPAHRLSFARNSDMTSRRLSLSMEPELKIEEGTVVLVQHEIHSIVFEKLFLEGKDLPYLSLVIQEYISSLVNSGIEPKNFLQLLYAKTLTACGKISTLLDMLRFYVFTDSFELANYLIGLIPVSESFLQFSVDMLFRMSAKERIIDVILEKNFIFESVQLLAKVSHPQFDIMKLFNRCQELGNDKLLAVITQFIKEKSL